MGDARRIDLRFAKADLESVTAILAQRLEHGGCAAVICNTVGRSIEVYRHLRNSLKETECALFHARTLQMWRRKREEDVLRKFGKGEKQPDGNYVNPDRPNRAVLVGTQVIEQSLDLDFDLMVSEIAPIDLLLQRLGRLHRHRRVRPEGLKTPCFVVLCDAECEGGPPMTFGKEIEHIYDRFILLRTWLALCKLRERGAVQLPAEIEGLVETVYGHSIPSVGDDWTRALEDARREIAFVQTESEKAAFKLLVSEPGDPTDLLDKFNDQLADDEDPEVHRTVRAATREGDPTVTVIMVEANSALAPEPSVGEVRDLLDRSVKLSHRGVYHVLMIGGLAPKEWAKNAHLRYARLLRLDGRGQVRVGGFLLTVDMDLGLVIEKDGEHNG